MGWSITRLILGAAFIALAGCTAQPVEPSGAPIPMQATRLALSVQQTCLVRATGAVDCWGLGAPTRLSLPGDRALVAVSGGTHFCGLAVDSTAYCWGQNLYGELGDGTRATRAVPSRVLTDLRFVAIAAGAYSTCALDPRGKAYCWGRNEYGALGIGSEGEGSLALTPVPVRTDLRFTTLDGRNGYCAIDTDQAVWCWGRIPGSFYDFYVAPGDCTNTYYVWFAGRPCLVPTPVQPGLPFSSLAGGGSGCAITAAGDTRCWGDGLFGALGDGRTVAFAVTPVQVTGGYRFRELTAGANFYCGLDLTGAAYCWGNNYYGHLGIGSEGSVEGDPEFRAVPTPVASTQRFSAVVAGDAHVCALTSNGRLWCWGSNDSQQLGASTSGAYSTVPVEVALPPL